MLPVIICVDDEDIVLSSLSKELKSFLSDAYQIEVALSGNETLELIEDLANETAEIAMVISDYTMPGMNGGQLLEKIKDISPNTIRCLLTGHAEMQDISATVNKSPLDIFILKPWKANELRSVVSQALYNYTLKKDARISQAKSAERNLALELVAKVAKAGSFTWTPEDDTISFSTQWLSTFDHEHYECNMSWYLSRIHPEDLDNMKTYLQALSGNPADAHETEFRIQDGKGNWRWVTNIAVKFKQKLHKSVNTIIFIEQDITEHKQKEEMLLQANQISDILKHVSEQIIFMTKEGKVVWANKNEDGSACNATDFVCFRQWGHNCHCHNCPVIQAIKTGESVYSEVKTDNGKFFAATATPIFDDYGEILGIVHSRLDITRQKELEARLQHNQKMESVGQLAAGIAHELNTPVQYISDNLNFLKKTFDSLQTRICEQIDLVNNQTLPSAALPDYLNSLFNNNNELKEAPSAFADALYGTSHIAKIISAMKDFTHPESSSPETTDLNQIITNAVTISKNEWKYVAEVETEFETESLNITCLPGSILQVIINMLVNAAHAIEERNVHEKVQGLITISTARVEDYAVVTISDNGNGIPDNLIHKIFDPFFTTKEIGKGTGQGLAITHDIIINKHNGKIDLQTTHGQGTTFTLWLPLSFKCRDYDQHNSMPHHCQSN